MVRKPRHNSSSDRAIAAIVATHQNGQGNSVVPLVENKGGRPRKPQGRDLLVMICARVATGETLTEIAKEAGMPSPPVFRAAVAKDPELQELWSEAKAERPHALFEEAIDLARTLKKTKWAKDQTNEVGALRVAIDTLRTAAARLNPREYGERQSAVAVVPVQINTTLGLHPGEAAPKERAHYSYDVQVLPAPSEEPFNVADK